MCLCREKFRQLRGIFKQQTKVRGEFIPRADRTLQSRDDQYKNIILINFITFVETLVYRTVINLLL